MTRLPSFPPGREWLNSKPISSDELSGHVVAINFWTYTCINWLRTLPYLRAWRDKYRDQGMLLIGVHTPEFSFEHDVDNVRQASRDMGITYPVVIDNDYAIWQSFANHYWPALYITDARGHIKHYWYGEGGYDESERTIQRLLAEAGARPDGGLVSVRPSGLELAADFPNVQSPENYLGYKRTSDFATPENVAPDRAHHYEAPAQLQPNQWALDGDWSVTSEASVLDQAGGRLANQFHSRDLNLVMGPVRREHAIPFRVRLDGLPPGDAHGSDIAPDGRGIADKQRTYQLVRQRHTIVDRRFEIEFLAPDVEALAFTFG